MNTEPKRTNFISIMHSSGTHAQGYQPFPVRTGYERVLAHRTDDLYATTADQDVTVESIDEKSLVVVYKDGRKLAIELGRRYGKVSNMVVPHEVVSPLKAGQRVKKGQILAYNTKYFQPDPTDPTQVVWKWGVISTTALMETTDTLEDSSAISQSMAEKLASELTTVRAVVVDKAQVVSQMVQVGQQLDVDSILCIIQDPSAVTEGPLSDDALDVLARLGRNTPRSKIKGLVEKIEVFYHADLDEMSESLRALAKTSNAQRRAVARALDRPSFSGQVSGTMRIEGEPIQPGQVVIRVYINGLVPVGVGDKAVFANQMKSIFGRVMAGTNRTSDGRDLDAIFGYSSLNNRIVLSAELMGTTCTLLKLISKRVAKAYRAS